MLAEIFYWIFNMSVTASFAGLAVILTGKIKKLPRRAVEWLWLIPFLRAILPFGINGRFNIVSKIISMLLARSVPVGNGISGMNYIRGASGYFPISYKTKLLENVFTVASLAWCVIAFLLLIIELAIYLKAKKELSGAVCLQDNVYISENISTAAVYGIIRPKIIIPKGYKNDELDFILAHENMHIVRHDNFKRLVAMLVACVYWFNPLSWFFLKEYLANIELACDEAVLKSLSADERKEYARTLLNAASCKHTCVSAFGGADVRARIDRILSYKKLSSISLVFIFLFIGAVSYVLLTNAA